MSSDEKSTGNASTAPEQQTLTTKQAIELAVRCQIAGDLQKAEGIYRQILQAEPDQPIALNLLGVISNQAGKPEVAVDLISKALNIAPHYAEAHNNLGIALKKQGKPDEAVASYRKAIEIKPAYAEAHSNLGNALRDLGKFNEAVESCHKALAVNPDLAEAHNNLGFSLLELGQPDEAATSCRKAIAIKPDYAEAHCNLGLALKELGRLDEAIASYNKALEINPDYAEAHSGLGIVQLSMGDFENGWRGYFWRWRVDKPTLRRRQYEQPYWDGEDLKDKTLFIYPEQGLGDFIQFSRYADLVVKKAGRVICEVPKSLYCLFSSFEGADMVMENGSQPEHFDFHVALLDLPKILGTTLQTVPKLESCLQAPSELIEKWKTKLAVHDGFHVGIVWGGNPDHIGDRKRSIDPILLKPLLELTGATFFSLQVGRDGEASETFGPKVVDLIPEATPFDDTAAVMINMDLVISVDTSLAHLAGALGRPVWTLLSYSPDWRWMLERNDSPWYPSMRLFRQKEYGAWEGVIREICQDLEEKIEQTGK